MSTREYIKNMESNYGREWKRYQAEQTRRAVRREKIRFALLCALLASAVAGIAIAAFVAIGNMTDESREEMEAAHAMRVIRAGGAV